jgi:transcriptional regulator with XRE-family HTH domain
MLLPMAQNINQSIADNIRKIRTLKGLDAKTIAEHLGISVSAYAKLERGETQIDIDRITAIADKLGVRPSDIMTFSPNNIFEKIDNSNVSTAINIDTQNQYSVPKEIIDSLTAQLKVKDEQLKVKDEQLSQLHATIQKLLEK